MKALLVIDMPKDCWDCHLVDEWGNCNAIKMTSERYGVSVKQNDKERPSWCPLRPLPERKDVPEYLETNRDWEAWGYDQCLAEILGNVATGETE